MTKIDIINRALLKLGEPPVSSLNDAAFGKSYEMIYEDMKNLLISSYPWRFAAKTIHLARLEEKYGQYYQYPLPSDCLLILKVLESGQLKAGIRDYQIAQNAIILDSDKGVDVEYVSAVSDEDKFLPLFREALAAKIAAELAMRLKHSINLKQVFENEFFNLIRQAELNNEIIKPAECMPDNSWVNIRYCW